MSRRQSRRGLVRDVMTLMTTAPLRMVLIAALASLFVACFALSVFAPFWSWSEYQQGRAALIDAVGVGALGVFMAPIFFMITRVMADGVGQIAGAIRAETQALTRGIGAHRERTAAGAWQAGEVSVAGEEPGAGGLEVVGEEGSARDGAEIASLPP